MIATATASLTLFSVLICLAIATTAVAAVTLIVLIIRDWRSGRLW